MSYYVLDVTNTHRWCDLTPSLHSISESGNRPGYRIELLLGDDHSCDANAESLFCATVPGLSGLA